MVQRLLAYADDPPFSSRHYLLDAFGGGFMAPDALTMHRTLLQRVTSRWQRLVRRAVGYGRLGDALLVLPDEEVRQRVLLYARHNYRSAVEAGYLFLQDAIERYDIRSAPALGEQRVEVAGRPLSWLTLITLKRALLLHQTLGPQRVVLEIGGGTGELARLMLHMGFADRFVIIEIPPAITLAEEVLLSHFSADQVDSFDPRRAELWSSPSVRCVLLMPDQAHLIDHADAAVNVASFGEMPRRAVEEYGALLKRIGVRAVVSINANRPHPINAAAGLDEGAYMRIFASEFRPTARYAWSKDLDLKLREPHPDYSGYEWLQFEREPG